MSKEWGELTKLTQGKRVVVERVKLTDDDIAIEGSFELPPLASLTTEDQVFVAAFIRCHGSIKQMEEMFGVSYPTIKSRLNRIGEMLSFVEMAPVNSHEDILSMLERGEITADEAVEMMKQ